MKNITTKALPNQLLGIMIAVGFSGLVLIALLIQLGGASRDTRQSVIKP